MEADKVLPSAATQQFLESECEVAMAALEMDFDSDSEKICLETIDHTVLDDGKKVWFWMFDSVCFFYIYIYFNNISSSIQITITLISDKWNIPNKDSEIILEKWLNGHYNGDKQQILKEFLIRGEDSKGNLIITVSVYFGQSMCICIFFHFIVK